MAETKKMLNPRAEIDTSAPFESVKEAVDRFGGSGPWFPLPHHKVKDDDFGRMEEETMQLERQVMLKQNQTLCVLNQLENAKGLVESLKLNSMHHSSMLKELKQAKQNLDKTSLDLHEIQASVESLSNKLRQQKQKQSMTFPPDPARVSFEFEAKQFRNMTEGSRYEVMKAIVEIEKTKTSLKMAEVRLIAARKMEEAARAVEAIAIAQGNTLENNPNLVALEEVSNEPCQTKEIQGPANGRVSLSQMLSEEEVTPHPIGDLVEKQYFLQKKKFGFIQVPIPIKKKSHPR